LQNTRLPVTGARVGIVRVLEFADIHEGRHDRSRSRPAALPASESFVHLNSPMSTSVVTIVRRRVVDLDDAHVANVVLARAAEHARLL